MARWRAEALERLPELRQCIGSANNVMALWIELWLAFTKAYEADPRDESLIGRTYSFADWCGRAPRGPDARHDPGTAVTVAFYEHIPNFKLAREDMPRWFRFEEVEKNREVFAYFIGDEQFDELVKYMKANRHRYQRRPMPPLASRG